MPQKRSRQGQTRADARYQRHYDQQTLLHIEKERIWNHAFFDKELDEVVNTIVCHEHPISQGEVLVDSRLRGTYQRLPH